MEVNPSFDGIWTAIVTPFNKANDEIDWKSFADLLERQSVCSGVVVSGTTGESPTLEEEEKIELVAFARKHLPKSVRVMAGTGGSNTTHSVRLSKACAKAGADSLLVVTPPYNKPNPSGLKRHYQAIAEATTLPICLYHVPGRTSQFLSVDALTRICQIPAIQSVKEASGDIAFFSRALNANPKLSFLSGDDPTYLASLSIGARGCISVVSNVFPKAMVALTTLFNQGKNQKAAQIHNALLTAIDVLFCETNPVPVKAALHHLGLCSDYLRAPLDFVSGQNQDRIANLIDQAKDQLLELGINEGL